MVVYFLKEWAVKSDALLTILFYVMVGFSAWQILCHHNRRGPREEHVYGHSDWSTVKSGATQKQGVFVYCGSEDIADFAFLCWFLYKLMLPLSIWVCLFVCLYLVFLSVSLYVCDVVISFAAERVATEIDYHVSDFASRRLHSEWAAVCHSSSHCQGTKEGRHIITQTM